MKNADFHVDVHQVKWHHSDRFETYEEAEAEARKMAYANGQDYAIFQAVAKAESPIEVNTVKVTKL